MALLLELPTDLLVSAPFPEFVRSATPWSELQEDGCPPALTGWLETEQGEHQEQTEGPSERLRSTCRCWVAVRGPRNWGARFLSKGERRRAYIQYLPFLQCIC